MPTFITLVSFNGADGAQPLGGVTVDTAGNLFGTTPSYGANNGIIFELASNAVGYTSTPAILYSNNGEDGSIGGNYSAGLIVGAAGDLFGTAASGGAKGFFDGVAGAGTVFELARDGSGYASTPMTLASFNGTDGSSPRASLLADAAGDLFGTTYAGGTSDEGAAFEVAGTGGGHASSPAALVSFNGSTGVFPAAGLIADTAGDLFGAAGGRRGRCWHGIRDSQDRGRLRQHSDSSGQL
jgi:hypothetical protein